MTVIRTILAAGLLLVFSISPAPAAQAPSPFHEAVKLQRAGKYK